MHSYWWQYDIGFFDGVIDVDLDVRLIGDSPIPASWEPGIESIWSTERFEVPIHVNVDFVTAGENPDQEVWLIPGWGRDSTMRWHTATSERSVAHEVGHFLGLFDEYAGAFNDPVNPRVHTGGLMDNLGPTLDEYYTGFLDWYAANRQMVDVPDGGSTRWALDAGC